MATVTVQVLEGGEIVETKPLPPDEYIVLCGERCVIAGVQTYPIKGTVVVTIKRPGRSFPVRGDEQDRACRVHGLDDCDECESTAWLAERRGQAPGPDTRRYP